MGETVVDGRTVRRFEHSWSMFDSSTETEYRYFNGSEIRNLAVAAVGEQTGTQDYAELPAPLREGMPQQLVDVSEQVDIDGDGLADTLRVQLTTTLARVATLSVPAGDFRNLVSARQAITVTVRLGGSGITASLTGSLTTWYAPSVGVVRRVFEDPSETAPNNVVIEELEGVSLGTTRAGLIPGVTVLDDIGFGNDSNTPALGTLALAGDRYLAVAVDPFGQVQGAIVAASGATLWRGTVLTLPPGLQFQSVAAAFDGTDFRVVATRHGVFTSPDSWALVSQRIGSSGELRDGGGGTVLDSGVADATQTLGSLRLAARNGQMLLNWGRFDPSLVQVSPGLVAPRGWVAEGRLYGAPGLPLAPRFELGAGQPAALAVRDDQYIAVNTSVLNGGGNLVAWAIDAAGSPVGTAPQTVSSIAGVKDAVRLHDTGSALWVSWAEQGLSFPANPTLYAARLGRDAVLLDGTPAAPGRVLLPAGDQRNQEAVVGIGATQSLLAWREGWNTLRATRFDSALLTGGGALPLDRIDLVPDALDGASGTSRSPLFAGAFDGGLLVAWIDNNQTINTPSDRVMVSLLRPRLVQ
jgi:hypothetical protein